MPTTTINPYLGTDNPYLTGTIDRAQADLARNYNLTAQPAYNAAMVRSGSFGNEGVNQMNQNAQLNLQNAMGNVSTQLRGQDYQNQQQLYMQQQGMDTSADQFNRQFDRAGTQWDQNFDRSVYNDSFSQNQQNLQTGIGLLGTLAGYNANDQQSATTQQNTPLNYWSQFANSANGIGNNFEAGTSTTGTSSNPFLQAIGGAQLGSKAWGSWANANNYGTSGNNYNGSSYDPTTANYENEQDRGTWGGWTK